MAVDLIEASVSLGARGLVVAGMGNGNPTAPAAMALAAVAKRGVVVVRSTRVVSGDVRVWTPAWLGNDRLELMRPASATLAAL
jgi:L-asparaginase/Glu-tRNA(Gln) amidotransferase subunit D